MVVMDKYQKLMCEVAEVKLLVGLTFAQTLSLFAVLMDDDSVLRTIFIVTAILNLGLAVWRYRDELRRARRAI